MPSIPSVSFILLVILVANLVVGDAESHYPATLLTTEKGERSTTLRYTGAAAGGFVNAVLQYDHRRWNIVEIGTLQDEWNAHRHVHKANDHVIIALDVTTATLTLLNDFSDGIEKGTEMVLTSAQSPDEDRLPQLIPCIASVRASLSPSDRTACGHVFHSVSSISAVDDEGTIHIAVRPLNPHEFLSDADVQFHAIGVNADFEQTVLEDTAAEEGTEGEVETAEKGRSFQEQSWFSDVSHFIGDVKDLIKKAKKAIKTVKRAINTLEGNIVKDYTATIFNFDTATSRKLKVSDTVFKEKVTAKLSAKASVHASLRLYTNISIHDYEVQLLSSVLHGKAGVDLSAELQTDAVAKKRFEIGSWNLVPIDVPIGPVIFVITPTLILNGGAHVKSEADIKASASVSGAVQVGFIYTKAAGFQPYTAKSFIHKGEIIPTHIKLVQAAVYIEAILTAVIDGIGGPSLALRAGPELEVAPVADLCAEARLSVSVNGVIAAVLLGKSHWHHVLFTYTRPITSLNIPDDSGECTKEKVNTGQCYCIGLDQDMAYKEGSDGKPNKTNIPPIEDNWYWDFSSYGRSLKVPPPEGSFCPTRGNFYSRPTDPHGMKPLPYWGCYGENTGWNGYNVEQPVCWRHFFWSFDGFCAWCQMWDGEQEYTNAEGTTTTTYNGTVRCRMPPAALVESTGRMGKPIWWDQAPWIDCAVIPRAKAATKPKLSYTVPGAKRTPQATTAQVSEHDFEEQSTITPNRVNSSISGGSFLGAAVTNFSQYPACGTASYVVSLRIIYSDEPTIFAALTAQRTLTPSMTSETILCPYSISDSSLRLSPNTSSWSLGTANWTYSSNTTSCPSSLVISRVNRLQLKLPSLFDTVNCPTVTVTAPVQLPCNGTATDFSCEFVQAASVPLVTTGGVSTKPFGELFAFAAVPPALSMPSVANPYEQPFPPVNTGPGGGGGGSGSGAAGGSSSTTSSGGAVIGVVVGVILLLVVVVVVVVVMSKKKPTTSTGTSDTELDAPMEPTTAADA